MNEVGGFFWAYLMCLYKWYTSGIIPESATIVPHLAVFVLSPTSPSASASALDFAQFPTFSTTQLPRHTMCRKATCTTCST